MNALIVSLIAFAIMLAGGFGASALRQVLPKQHLADDTKDLVRLGTGLIGTIAALVLGLLIASAKGSYDSQRGNVQHIAADTILIDQLMAVYGPEAKPAREQLRLVIEPLVARIWRENQSGTANQIAFTSDSPGQEAYLKIALLAPQTELQRILKDRTIQIILDLAQARLTLFEQSSNAIPVPFVVVLVLWLAILFASFGLFSQVNPISVTALIIFALSASCALFLVLQLSDPFTGLLQISSAPLRDALGPL
jgi:hypothetical protein